MTTMVERVASAIYRASHGGDVALSHEMYPWPPAEEHVAERYRYIARAAIAVMREPTAAMEVACVFDHDIQGPVLLRGAGAWRAMVDAALKE